MLAFSVAALALLALRLGLLTTSGRRASALAAVAVAGLLALPSGTDFADVKRFNLLLLVGLCGWLAARRWRVPAALEAGRDVAALCALLAVAAVAYLNFGHLHGRRTFVHDHDVAHYYLGSKYFAETGYDGLYMAMARVEVETQDALSTPQARDLATNDLVPLRALVARSGAVRARFSEPRWAAFTADVVMFRERLGRQFGKLLRDHGFNPTPVWPTLFGPLASLVPAGSARGVFALTLLDPLLLALAGCAAAWGFGARGALLLGLSFTLTWGATFGYTGGAFLRHVWFAACVGALACWHRERPAVAGALLALATALRLFPALLLIGPAAAGLPYLLRDRRWPRPQARLLLAFAGVLLALVAATAFGARGLGAWPEFGDNFAKHALTAAPNLVGLGAALVSEPGQWGPLDGTTAALQRHLPWLAGIPVALAIAWLAPRVAAAEAFALGVCAVFVAGNLASYYWVVLSLVALAWCQRDGRLLALFGLEAVSHALFVLGMGEARLFALRSGLLAWFCLGWLLEDAREARRAAASALGAAEQPLGAVADAVDVQEHEAGG